MDTLQIEIDCLPVTPNITIKSGRTQLLELIAFLANLTSSFVFLALVCKVEFWYTLGEVT